MVPGQQEGFAFLSGVESFILYTPPCVGLSLWGKPSQAGYAHAARGGAAGRDFLRCAFCVIRNGMMQSGREKCLQQTEQCAAVQNALVITNTACEKCAANFHRNWSQQARKDAVVMQTGLSYEAGGGQGGRPSYLRPGSPRRSQILAHMGVAFAKARGGRGRALRAWVRSGRRWRS